MMFSSSRFDHITPLLRQLHWLKVPERIDYKLALLVYKCLQGVAPSYLADDLCRTARHRLRSASLLCAVRGCRRTATELSRLPPRESGTVCHITSRLHSHCLFSAAVCRLISSAAVFVDYTVVPAK